MINHLVDKKQQEEIVQKIINKEITVEQYRGMLDKSTKRIKELTTELIKDLLKLEL